MNLSLRDNPADTIEYKRILMEALSKKAPPSAFYYALTMHPA